MGEVDLFRALHLLPSAAAADDGSGLYIRGGTPDQNLVLFDGMTVYHVDHFFGLFSAFNADAVKDVNVYTGGFPAKYGGRVSSVVELTGKIGDEQRFRAGGGVNLLSARGVAEEEPRRRLAELRAAHGLDEKRVDARGLERDDEEYHHCGGLIRLYLVWSLNQKAGSVPPRDLDLSDRLDDEALALGYLLLLDEYGVDEHFEGMAAVEKLLAEIRAACE